MHDEMATLIGSYFVWTFFAWVYKYKHNYIVCYCTNLHLHFTCYIKGPIIDEGKSLYPNLYFIFYFSNSNIGISGSNVWSICITFLCWELCQDLLEPKYGILQIFRILLYISRFFCPTRTYFIVYLYLSQIFRWECDFKILRGLNFVFTLEFQLFSGFFKSLCYPKHRQERKGVTKFQFVWDSIFC